MDWKFLVCDLTVIFYLLLSNIVPFSRSQTTGSRLQVSQHFVTLRPNDGQVSVPESCTSQGDYSICDGELRESYTWSQENTETNYVLFVLDQKAAISHINLTYIVASDNQRPKVSFCIVREDTFINSSFMNLNCDEMSIQPLASGEKQTSTLNVPMNNGTSKVAMEVITESIKVDFVATKVKFYGVYEPSTATSPGPDETESSSSTINGSVTELSTQPETTLGSSRSADGAMYTAKTYTITLLSVALSIFTILTITVIF